MTRIIENLLEPIGLLWLLQLALLAGCLWRRKWRWALLFAAVASFVFLVGSTRIPARLLASLERPYADQPIDRLEPADAIVMLGGLLLPSKHDPLGVQFGDAVDRMLTATELLRSRKANWLVLGGGFGSSAGAAKEPWRESEMVSSWLDRWGLGTNVIRLGPSLNTREEAVQVKELMRQSGWQRILLVTSGYHMKRAAALFRQLEIPFQPVACDFVGLSELERVHPFNPVPDSQGFRHLELYLHEKIGWLYYKARGWVAE